MHCEVLIRLRDEQGALIPPGLFLPAAERFNLMSAIDRWVVTQVLAREASESCCDINIDCMIAINLSGASLGDERFLAFLREALTNPAITPRRLCFEITETAAINNLSRAAAFMLELKTFGCRFALDDFGSGLSSFGYLKNLPVDYLKIDGALVKGVVESRTDLAMVKAINEIGHTLGIQTIAEFVENSEIRDKLAQLGVDFVQGYGVERPRPFDD
jgi:EAL domain-containing protein (putative c-di-GMP-specific phosphodiesterase class I)